MMHYMPIIKQIYDNQKLCTKFLFHGNLLIIFSFRILSIICWNKLTNIRTNTHQKCKKNTMIKIAYLLSMSPPSLLSEKDINKTKLNNIVKIPHNMEWKQGNISRRLLGSKHVELCFPQEAVAFLDIFVDHGHRGKSSIHPCNLADV